VRCVSSWVDRNARRTRFRRHGVRERSNQWGGEPVREWLKGLSPDDRKRIGEDIKTVEFGWPVGMPVCRPLGGGIYEVRSGLAQNRIARVLFYIDRKTRMVLLHRFIKKTQKTPCGCRISRLSSCRASFQERGLMGIPEWEEIAIPEGFGPYRLLYNPISETVIAELRSIEEQFSPNQIYVRHQDSPKYEPIRALQPQVTSLVHGSRLERL
jgi:phage-related protein